MLKSDESALRDGFQELRTYIGHKRQVRGSQLFVVADEGRQDLLLSWDSKAVYLWEKDLITKSIRFPKAFISTSLDMTFKIFDRYFRLIETISHTERAITDCVYDQASDILILAGAIGVSVWRIFRTNKNSFVLEKVYAFHGCNEWISRIVYDSRYRRVYALMETSVYVLDMRYRNTLGIISNAHDAPITYCIWYPIDQFFITSCARGQIRFWSPNHKSNDKTQPTVTNSVSTHTLLHTIIAHSKSVSGLSLHPTPGMFVSASLDGYIKVISLETFEVLQSLNTGDPISLFSLIKHFDGRDICIFSRPNGDIYLWKVEFCTEYFDSCGERIEKLIMFEDLYVLANKFKKKKQIVFKEPSEDEVKDSNDLTKNSSITRPLHSTPVQLSGGSRRRSVGISFKKPELIVPLQVNIDDLSVTGSNDQSNGPESETLNSNDRGTHIPIFEAAFDTNEIEIQPKLTYEQRNSALNTVILAKACQDIKLLATSSNLVSRIEPEQLIDDVLFCTYSVHQKLIFCVLDSGVLRIVCTRSSTAVILRDFTISSLLNDKPTSIALVHGLTLDALRSVSVSKDMRGNPSASYESEALCIGTAGGTLLLLDSYHECALISAHQLYPGKIDALYYRFHRSELLSLGFDMLAQSKIIKVVDIPSICTLHELQCDHTFSTWGYSLKQSYIALGCTDGICRLYTLVPIQNTIVLPSSDKLILNATSKENKMMYCEIHRQDDNHVSSIIGITFCDERKIYATSSTDLNVKIWNMQKIALRTIIFDFPPESILFLNDEGDILVSQNNIIVKVRFNTWNSNHVLESKEEIVEDELEQIDLAPTTIIRSPNKLSSSKSRTSTAKSDTFLTENINDSVIEVPNLRGYWSSSEFDMMSDENSTYSNFSSNTIKVFDVRHPKFTPNQNNRPKKEFIPSLAMKQKRLIEEEEFRMLQESTRDREKTVAVVPRKPTVANRKSFAKPMHANRHAFISPKFAANSEKVSTISDQPETTEVQGGIFSNFENLKRLHSPNAMLSLQQQFHSSFNGGEVEESYFVKVNGPTYVSDTPRRANRFRRDALQNNNVNIN